MNEKGEDRSGQVTRRQFLRVVSVAGATAVGVASAKPAGFGAGKVFKIGAAMPLTGAYAEQGINSLHGVELAVSQINTAGGVKALGGATLEVVSADTSTTDPTRPRRSFAAWSRTDVSR